MASNRPQRTAKQEAGQKITQSYRLFDIVKSNNYFEPDSDTEVLESKQAVLKSISQLEQSTDQESNTQNPENDNDTHINYNNNGDSDEYNVSEEDDHPISNVSPVDSTTAVPRTRNKKEKKRRANNDDNKGGDTSNNDTPPKKMKVLQFVSSYLRPSSVSDKQPVLGAVNSLLFKEQRARRELAFTVMDGYRADESYRWPVRETLLPCVPKSTYVDARDPDFFEQQGMEFVEDLTGVPKTEDDYSTTEDENEDEDEEGDDVNNDGEQDDDAEEAKQERLLELRREAKRRAKDQRERHEDERAASQRLEEVQEFFSEQMASFAQQQFRKGVPYRIHDLYTFQQQTLPQYRIRATRAPIGMSKAGDEQEDELTPIQEKASIFEAEDTLRTILYRLPYVIRQGALGEEPEYVRLGLPKPVSEKGGYERTWDTTMAAASLCGIDDRILKKVSHRMKNLLAASKFSRYYEEGSEAIVAKCSLNNSGFEDEDMGMDPVIIKRLSGEKAPRAKEWDKLPKPHYVKDGRIDPLDPRYSRAAIMKNVRQRNNWHVEVVGPGEDQS
ncbi:hypothetical protein BGX28_003060 [Mortierella sp. GBA30]|nr:hypothetical protein BGX28_003060 [Mortierella sp. GBA30]